MQNLYGVAWLPYLLGERFSADIVAEEALLEVHDEPLTIDIAAYGDKQFLLDAVQEPYCKYVDLMDVGEVLCQYTPTHIDEDDFPI